MNGPQMIDTDFRYILNRSVDEKAARQIHALLAHRLKKFKTELCAELARSLSKPGRFPASKHNAGNPAQTRG